MNGNKLFLDTNILLYLLAGDETLTLTLDQKQFYISFVTQLEILSFPGLSKKDLKVINELLNECVIIDVNTEIKKLTVEYRKNYKLKLPDCLIAATSIYLDIPLITADSDFKKVEELNLIYYEK